MLKKTIVLFALAAILAATAHADSQVWNFDKDKTGEVPTGFMNEAGQWKVTADSTAPSQSNAVAQLAKSPGSTFNLLLLDKENFKDVDISVAMKAVAGSEDRGGGLVWRTRDSKNYYICPL